MTSFRKLQQPENDEKFLENMQLLLDDTRIYLAQKIDGICSSTDEFVNLYIHVVTNMLVNHLIGLSTQKTDDGLRKFSESIMDINTRETFKMIQECIDEFKQTYQQEMIA